MQYHDAIVHWLDVTILVLKCMLGAAVLILVGRFVLRTHQNSVIRADKKRKQDARQAAWKEAVKIENIVPERLEKD